MSIEKVKAYLRPWGKEDQVLMPDIPTATVEQAAKALGVIPARIAKSLTFHGQEGVIMVVVAGDAKIDNRKFKNIFHCKAKMLSPAEAITYTGHAVGGVCPFALPETVSVYLDISLKRFDTVFPACGTSNSAIELTPGELFEISGSKGWFDLCKGWQEAEPNI